MAKVEGLNTRGTWFYVKVIIPGDLTKLYGKTRVNVALKTTERREAILRATIRRAEWLAEFENKRRMLAHTNIAAVSPEFARLLAERVRATVLSHDDALRSDLPLMADLSCYRWRATHSRLAIPPKEHFDVRRDDLTGLTSEEAQTLAGLNGFLDGKAAVALASQNLAMVLPLVILEAAQLGVSFTATTPGGRQALLLAPKAYRTAHRERTMRDCGEVINTPVVLAPAPATHVKTQTLRDVFERWQASGDKPRAPDTIAACNRALVIFEAFAPGALLGTITRAQGDSFRTWMRTNSNTTKTARDRLNCVVVR